MRVWLLGGFRVSVGSRSIRVEEWHLRKASSLVKLLALAPGYRLHREQAMEMLWPDLDSEAANNNLHRTLHSARRSLELTSATAATDPGYLQLRGGLLALCPSRPLWVDVEGFEEATATAQCSQDPVAYRAAIDLYAGELLPEDRYESWAEDRRVQLRRAYLSLLVEMAKLYEEREELGAAIEALGRVVTNEPTHEEAHTDLMRLYAISGQRHQALWQYEQLRKALRNELDSEPGAASQGLYQKIATERFLAPHSLPTKSVPLIPPQCLQNNLPSAPSSFIGREHEMLEVKRLLSMTRLLTLTGTAGCGKTRLSLKVAADLVGMYQDGVWLVELAGLSEPALVPQVVATVLKVRDRPGLPLTSTLVEALHSKHMLLVLDNCEHMIDACAQLVDTLLIACPHLRVLSTSREALSVSGEVNWPVLSLTVPPAGDLPATQSLAQYEAIELFLARARSRLPTFVLTPDNAQAVVEICRRLEGMPLAIELATARMTVLAVEQVAARLKDTLGLLTGGSRTADPRQRTLRATLDWSFELLDEPEQSLFGRLSVFAGGWTLEAAEAVGAGGGIGEGDVLDLLGRLVDKSLVMVEANGDGGVRRYRMLESVRQYGAERLEGSEEAERSRRRHTTWFLGLVEEAEPKLKGPEQEAWLKRLELEHDNLRAALSWTLDPQAPEQKGERAELGLRLAAALGRFWGAYAPSEGRGWLERGLTQGSASPASVRAKALNEAGWIVLFQNYGRGIAMLEESLALFRELGDKPGVATVLASLGWAVGHQDDKGRMTILREEAEALQREHLDQWTLAHLLLFLGFAALIGDDYERAVALLEECLALFRELGDMRSVAMCLTCLGLAEAKWGDHERAAAPFEEALRLLRKEGDKVGIASLLLGLAGVAGSRGEPARAARLWGASEALREAIGMHLTPLARSHYDYEGRLAAARSLLDEPVWTAAWREGRAMTLEQVIEYTLGEGEVEPPKVSAPQVPSAGSQPPNLTYREREIALLVAQGLTNRKIATVLVLSEHTVATHVRAIFKKLGFHSRTQVATWIIERQPLP